MRHGEWSIGLRRSRGKAAWSPTQSQGSASLCSTGKEDVGCELWRQNNLGLPMHVSLDSLHDPRLHRVRHSLTQALKTSAKRGKTLRIQMARLKSTCEKTSLNSVRSEARDRGMSVLKGDECRVS